MTDQSIRCGTCQAELPAGVDTCPACGARRGDAGGWPEWHGEPQREDADRDGWQLAAAAEDPAVPTYAALNLDPKLTDVGMSRPGKRWGVVSLVVVTVVWLLVGQLYESGDPAAWWDIIWYAAGALTVGLTIWLLVALIHRARTHGLGPAVRWLVS